MEALVTEIELVVEIELAVVEELVLESEVVDTDVVEGIALVVVVV